jgi:HEAT repeat protein
VRIFDCAKALQDVIKFGPEAVSPLIQLLLYGVPPEIAGQVPGNVLVVVRSRAISALGEVGDNRALSPLGASLQDSDSLTRAGAAGALGKLDGEAVLTVLLPLLKDTDPLVRETAASALGKLKRPEALPALRDAARAELKPHVRHAMDAAIDTIGQH